MIFFDSNLLVYQFDHADPRKRTIAQQLMAQHAAARTALLSTQVLQEFYSVMTRKFRDTVTADFAYRALAQFARLPTVEISRVHVLNAALRSRQRSLSFWDALIIEAALAGGATTLFSEDMQHGATIDGVTIENPFL